MLGWIRRGIAHVPSTAAAVAVAAIGLALPAEVWAEAKARLGAFAGALDGGGLALVAVLALWRKGTRDA